MHSSIIRWNLCVLIWGLSAAIASAQDVQSLLVRIKAVGKEGVGKSKLGEWIVTALQSSAMTLTSGERLTGRFNAHFESLLFAMAEEVFWAGDRTAEGVIKALATANIMDYERKGLDPVAGRNYTRLMIASNNPWVVPAWSGGRRWFVLEVGNKHEKDFPYFAAIDEEMEKGDSRRCCTTCSTLH